MTYCRSESCPIEELHEAHDDQRTLSATSKINRGPENLKAWHERRRAQRDAEPVAVVPAATGTRKRAPASLPPAYTRHRAVKPRVLCVCDHCHSVFEQFASIVARGWGRFCSNACRQGFQQLHPREYQRGSAAG